MRRPNFDARRTAEALELARDLGRRAWVAIRNTPGLLLLSLLLGISLWVFITDEQNPTQTDVFPSPVAVRAVNVGTGLAVANQLPAVEVRLAAPQDRWEAINSGNLSAYVDLVGLEAREQEVRVQVDVEGISGVRVVETIPRTVIVNLEDVVQEEVSLTTRVVGTLPLGYQVDSVSPARTTAIVSGPRSLVDLVREAAADVNVTGRTVSLEESINLVPLGAGGGEIRGVRVQPPTVTVRVDITQTVLHRTTPLRVVVNGDPAPGFRVSNVSVSPSTVRLEGSIDALQQLDAITLPQVDISGARSDIARAIEIRLPPGVRAAEPSTATVIVTIAPVDGSVRRPVVPEIVGLDPELQAEVDEDSVEVILEGPLPVLNALQSGDVRVRVDVSGLGAGTHERPITVEAPEGITIRSVQPAMVSVTLSE